MKKKVEKENLITSLYCRLSVDDIQREDGMDSSRIKEELESNSITHQKQILEDYCKKEDIRNYRFFTDATVIIGLKQNPTNGRRFSPIFYIIGHFVGQNTGCHYKPRRKTEYGTG